ncbi:guanylate kinase [bacterium]|nr:guanylate kinase [bacterium]|tara:strand:+ start:5109 stop:5678 length:570 start_codon:yes stop_codon:yes gene_type:complete
MKKNKLFAIIGPSGAGKGTVIKEIKKLFPTIKYPISFTTRKKREGEIEGEVYHFISQEKFQEMIDKNEFLEYQKIHNNAYYGSSKKEIIDNLDKFNLLREFDIQGVKAIEKIIPKENLVKIFITVDKWETLEQRILKRSKIDKEELLKRKASFEKEVKYMELCDHVIQSKEDMQEELIQDFSQIIKKYI